MITRRPAPAQILAIVACLLGVIVGAVLAGPYVLGWITGTVTYVVDALLAPIGAFFLTVF